MSDAVLVSPAPGGLRARLDGRVARVVASCAALHLLVVALGGAARLFAVAPSAVPLAVAPPDPEWVEVPEPERIFDLQAPLLEGLPRRYSERRRPGGEREDSLLFGVPGPDAPFAQLRVRHGVDGDVARPPLFATVAREAAEAGLAVEHAGLADLMPSRLGDFETVDLVLADGAANRFSCTGLRLAGDRPAATLSGLVCGALGRPVERAALRCLVDRLVPAPGTDRASLDVFARAAPPREASCGEIPSAGGAGDKVVTPLASSRRR